MNLFGFEITRRKALTLSSVPDTERGWITVLDRPPGAFQQDVHIHPWRVQSNWVIFACQTLIAGDVGKLSIQIVEEDANGIYNEVTPAAFSPVLRKPNGYQTSQKFFEQWMLSKLSHGNAYILKERDDRKVVVGLTVLDPHKVTPLVAPDGSVYYQLGEDDLAQVPEGLPAVPASEIMHDRMWCLFHPLVGLSPIFASGLAAIQGLNIQGNSVQFFANASRPSGILIAPQTISDETAKRLKTDWEKNYTGASTGKVAVLGDGLKYEPMTQNAVDSQMVEQLKMSAEMVCSTYHVPAYKVGVGPIPTYQNAQVLNQIYYDDCLQTLITGVQSQLNEGLGLTAVVGHKYCARFNLDDLLLMDSQTQIETIGKAIGAGAMAPNEGRKKLNLKPVKGGDTPYLQQQNYSLTALDKRDTGEDPFKGNAPAPPPDQAKSNVYAMLARARKGLKNAAA